MIETSRRLAELGRRRARFRYATGLLAVGLYLAITILIAFTLDWTFRLGRPERTLVLLASLIGLFDTIRRFVVPAFRYRDDPVTLALLVERWNRIDTDLVAAMEFSDVARPKFGSPIFREEVIRQVESRTPEIDFMQGISYTPLKLPAALLGSILLVLTILHFAWPDSSCAFWNRIFLGEAHYPTNTRIEKVLVAGREASLSEAGTGWHVELPFDSEFSIDIITSGVQPESGSLHFDHPAPHMVRLEPLTESETSREGDLFILRSNANIFRSSSLEKVRIREQLSGRIFLGDAWVDPIHIEVLPLPIVELVYRVTPPEYQQAGSNQSEEVPGRGNQEELTTRQIAVVQGSKVELQLRSQNKPLDRVLVKSGTTQWKMTSEESLNWTLPRSGTPFESMDSPISFQIEAIDRDGLEPSEKLIGSIRIKPDLPPTVAIAIVTRKVISTAKPILTWGITDDRKVASAEFVLQLFRNQEQVGEVVREIKLGDGPPNKRSYRGRTTLDFKGLDPQIGDEIKIFLRADDERGKQTGKIASSQPLLLEVTDLEGIISSLAESDQESLERLESMIERQLGIGE